jgi:hypothetical protein
MERTRRLAEHLVRLGKFEHHQRDVISGRTVTPGHDAVEDLLLHFSQRQVGNIADNFL